MMRQEVRSLRATLLVMAPLALLLGPSDLSGQTGMIAGGIAGLMALGAITLTWWPVIGRSAATLATLGFAVQFTLPRIERPGWGFLVLLALSLLLARIWPPGRIAHGPRSQHSSPAPEAYTAAVVLVAAWLFLTIGRIVPGWHGRPEIQLAAIVPPLAALMARRVTLDNARRAALAVALVAAASGPALIALHQPAAASALPLLAAAGTLVATRNTEDSPDSAISWMSLLQHPPRMLFVSFALQCLLGGLLLTVPASTARGQGVTFIDALFTAVSATCVTGLTVLDTSADWTTFGQVIILLLIQIGGLGIMTFSAAALLALSRRVSFRTEAAAADLVGAESVGELSRALGRVLLLTFGVEAIGAGVLTAAFWRDGDPLPVAAWRGLFTAVSAFCNAGFTLQSNSFAHYASQPLVLHTVAVLVVLGGLGPGVVLALPRFFRARTRRALSVHQLLVVEMTAAMVLLPAVFIALFEWEHALSGMSILDRLNNAWFQATALRTGGFHVVDLKTLQPATITVMLATMFVGGSPGSAAGGAKTTTIAVLLLAVQAAINGRHEVEVHRRHIPHDVIYRAGAIATLCFGTVGVAMLALQTTQAMDLQTALFECVSAMGTVGLTLGGTAHLDDFGKIIIMGCMFAGRVGPLTLFLLLSDSRRTGRAHLPQEAVPVG